MSIASVDINVQGKIRTLSRSLPCERLLADLGPQEVDLYREEKAEAGPERQRTRGFHPTFTRAGAPLRTKTPDRRPSVDKSKLTG